MQELRPLAWTRAGFVDLCHPDSRVFHDRPNVARQLSGMNRWNSVTQYPWDVGQHSLLGALISPPWLRDAFLWHDAHEIVIGNIPHPVMLAYPQLLELDHRWSKAGIEFGLGRQVDDNLLRAVKAVDNFMAALEAKHLLNWPSDQLQAHLGVSCETYRDLHHDIITPFSLRVSPSTLYRLFNNSPNPDAVWNGLIENLFGTTGGVGMMRETQYAVHKLLHRVGCCDPEDQAIDALFKVAP